MIQLALGWSLRLIMKHYSVVMLKQCRRFHTVSGTILMLTGFVNAGLGIERIANWGIWDATTALILYGILLCAIFSTFCIKEIIHRGMCCASKLRTESNTGTEGTSDRDVNVPFDTFERIMNVTNDSPAHSNADSPSSSSGSSEGDMAKLVRRVRRLPVAFNRRFSSARAPRARNGDTNDVAGSPETTAAAGEASKGGTDADGGKRRTGGFQLKVSKFVNEAKRRAIRSRNMSLTSSAMRIAKELSKNRGHLHPTLTWSDVRDRVSLGSQLIVVAGRVFDIRRYLPSHPGGELILIAHIGTDATKLVRTRLSALQKNEILFQTDLSYPVFWV